MCAHDEDIYPNGACGPCARDASARYRRRRRLAMAVLNSAEARGFAGSELMALVQHVDIDVVRECATRGFTPGKGGLL